MSPPTVYDLWLRSRSSLSFAEWLATEEGRRVVKELSRRRASG